MHLRTKKIISNANSIEQYMTNAKNETKLFSLKMPTSLFIAIEVLLYMFLMYGNHPNAIKVCVLYILYIYIYQYMELCIVLALIYFIYIYQYMERRCFRKCSMKGIYEVLYEGNYCALF